MKIDVWIKVCQTCNKLLDCKIILSLNKEVISNKCCCGQSECEIACTEKKEELSHGYCSICHAKDNEKSKEWARRNVMKKNEYFNFCTNCHNKTNLLFPVHQGEGRSPLFLCKKCKEDYKKGLLLKITSETRYHEMAKNLAKREGVK